MKTPTDRSVGVFYWDKLYSDWNTFLAEGTERQDRLMYDLENDLLQQLPLIGTVSVKTF